MEPTPTSSAVSRQSPKLLHSMVVVAMVSITVIVMLVGSGIYQVFERQLVEIAEKDAVQASNDLVRREAAELLRTGPQGQVDLAVDLEQLSRLDERLHQILEPFNIVKINIFSPEWLILYSTDRSLIGQNDFGNSRLNRALKGEPDSLLVRHEKLTRAGERTSSTVDVVETYVPIHGESGQIVGCFKIYRDVTGYRQDLLTGVMASVILLLFVLLGVFGLSYLFLRQAARRLQVAQEEIRRASILDELTGVANRKEILQRASIEISRMKRLEEQVLDNCLAILVVDLDRLRMVNQEYGRKTGDEVLRSLTKRLSLSLRGYDSIGRYGEDDFLIILPANTRRGALATAERLREKIRAVPFTFNNFEIEVTISIGLAIANTRDHTFESAFERAQFALKQAKQNGGNCVVAAEPGGDLENSSRVVMA